MCPTCGPTILKAEKGDSHASAIPSQIGNVQISTDLELYNVKSNFLGILCVCQYQLQPSLEK